MQLSCVCIVPKRLQLQRKRLSRADRIPAAADAAACAHRVLGNPHHSVSGLTSALSRFTALQALSLGRTDSSTDCTNTTLAGGTDAVLLPMELPTDLRALPSLASLELQGVPVSAAEAVALPSQLSRLVFDSCELSRGLHLTGMTNLLQLDMVGPTPPQLPSLESEAGECARQCLAVRCGS